MLHVRLLRRAASGEYDLTPDQLFSTIEQLLFTKVLAMAEKEGKPVRLAVASANDLWDGILRAAVNLESSAIAVGNSAKLIDERTGQWNWDLLGSECRSRGLTWLWRFLRRRAQEQIFYLGPHAPRLTPKEIDLLHQIWLKLSDKLAGMRNSIITISCILRWMSWSANWILGWRRILGAVAAASGDD